jgi:hypothetical protein
MDQAFVEKSGIDVGRKSGSGSIELCSPLGGCQKCDTLQGICICVNNEIGEPKCFNENFVVIEGSSQDSDRDDIILSYDTIREQELFQSNPSLLKPTRAGLRKRSSRSARKKRQRKLRSVKKAQPTALTDAHGHVPASPARVGPQPSSTPPNWSPQIVRAGRRRLHRHDSYGSHRGKEPPTKQNRTRPLSGGERRAFRRYRRYLAQPAGENEEDDNEDASTTSQLDTAPPAEGPDENESHSNVAVGGPSEAVDGNVMVDDTYCMGSLLCAGCTYCCPHDRHIGEIVYDGHVFRDSHPEEASRRVDAGSHRLASMRTTQQNTQNFATSQTKPLSNGDIASKRALFSYDLADIAEAEAAEADEWVAARELKLEEDADDPTTLSVNTV